MSGNKHVLGSDLAKVDAHVITAEEYEELPELSDEWFAKADLHENGKLISRGRPPKEAPKKPVSIRLDPDLLDFFKSSGPGWQTRVNDILRDAAGLPKLR